MDGPQTSSRQRHRHWRWRGGGVAMLLFALAAAAAVLLPANTASGKDPASLLGLRVQAVKIQAQVDKLDQQAEVAIEQYDSARATLDEVTSRLAKAHMQLSAAQIQLANVQTILSERAVAIYKNGTVNLLDVLLSARDLSDLETQLQFYQRLSARDVANEKQEQRVVDAVTRLNQQISIEQVRARALATDLRVKTQVITDKLAQRQAILKDVNSGIKQIVKQQQADARLIAKNLALRVKFKLGNIKGSNLQDAVIHEAMKYLGVPYVWGGASPSGFDCSGLVLYVYAKFGVNFPHAATMQAYMGMPVPLDELQPADLVFFGNPSFYHHVGIYAGNGLFIEAPHTGDVVKVSELAGRGATLACRYVLHPPKSN